MKQGTFFYDITTVNLRQTSHGLLLEYDQISTGLPAKAISLFQLFPFSMTITAFSYQSRFFRTDYMLILCIRWLRSTIKMKHAALKQFLSTLCKSRKENPQKLTQLSSRSHPKTPRGKKDSTKRHHHRHHKRQPGEQQFPKQVVTG